MKHFLSLLSFSSFFSLSCTAQTALLPKEETRAAAIHFLQSFSPEQDKKAHFTFEDEERHHWNYVPIECKGIPLKELTEAQYASAMALLRTTLSDTAFEKAKSIIQLEVVLKEVENRSADDHYRDPGKYCVSIFGNPASDAVWGWRFEGHHVAFNFTSDGKGLVAGTPGFMGANPAVVQAGPQKGKEVLKDETRLGFALLHSLDEGQKRKAIIDTKAPGEIITGNSRKAMIEKAEGIAYSELSMSQREQLLRLLRLYLYRYKKPLAQKMMKEAEVAGWSNLRFAWAGAEQPGIGNPHYYRMQGPTLIIEYDNTQNNANHVHTVIRDLKNDFGGDQLLEHYHHGQH